MFPFMSPSVMATLQAPRSCFESSRASGKGIVFTVSGRHAKVGARSAESDVDVGWRPETASAGGRTNITPA